MLRQISQQLSVIEFSKYLFKYKNIINLCGNCGENHLGHINNGNYNGESCLYTCE